MSVLVVLCNLKKKVPRRSQSSSQLESKRKKGSSPLVMYELLAQRMHPLLRPIACLHRSVSQNLYKERRREQHLHLRVALHQASPLIDSVFN